MKMLGKTTCRCCQHDTKTREKRSAKRRERQAWKKSLRIS